MTSNNSEAVSSAAANNTFDVVVLGAGPGGYVAAIRAAQLGLKTAIIERDNLGGVCLNWGCIPTKSLLRNAEVMHLLHQGKDYGFSFDNLKVNYAAAHKRSRDVSGRLVKGVGFLMRKNNITVIQGEGVLKDANTVLVELKDSAREVIGRHIILATGARPFSLPMLKPDGQRVFTYRQLLDVSITPKSMIVIGSGAIGMEFAYVFNAYGVQVTVIEALPQILPLEDPEVSQVVVRSFTRSGVKLLPATKVEDAKTEADGVSVSVADTAGNKQTLKADWLLMAMGVAPNTQGIGLEAAGVKANERGYIPVDTHMATNVPNVYAIGDINGLLRLAHVASAQGIVAAEHIAASMGKYDGHLAELDYDAMPRCTYTHPQVASMGLTEQQAKDKGYSVKVSKFPFQANGKSLALNNTEGFAKIIADAKYGEILGVHMVGPDVTELLPEFVLAKSAELTTEQIAHAVHAHPTLSESLMEAAHGIEGQMIHL